MSTPSARRLKERGSRGIAAPLTGKISPVAGKSIPTGKENPRPTPRVRSGSQKPNVRPIARTDKSAVEEPRSRCFTSSVPRGRCSSPSEFTKMLSDLRKNSSRGSLNLSDRKENGVSLNGLIQKSDLEERVLKDLVKNGITLGKMEGGVQGKGKLKVRILNNRISEIMVGNSASVLPERPYIEKSGVKDIKKNARNSEELDGSFEVNEKIDDRVSNVSCDKKEYYLNNFLEKRSDPETCYEKSTLEFDLKSTKFSEEVKIKSYSGTSFSGLSSIESPMVSESSKFPVVLKENVPNKYPSKLHEKLAFLEGKVKRIASDISRTKELLDLNNVDASKMILSDIQADIAGIDNSMVHDSRHGDVEMLLVGENKEKCEKKEVANCKSLVNGLSAEELEARLFPLHKLMRDRTSSRTKSRGSETNTSTSSSNLNRETVASFDENNITSEFLASLSNEEYRDESKIQEMDEGKTFLARSYSLNALSRKLDAESFLMAEENFDEFDDQDIEPAMVFDEGLEENKSYNLNEIGCKTSTGGWFVSEGESVLLAHDDGSCSFYDIVNCERKAEYKPPSGILPNTWQDCWMIRAPNADGSSGRFIIAASAGNSVGPGFCSWDFYTKCVTAFHIEDGKTTIGRPALAPLPSNTMYMKNGLHKFMDNETLQWWYKPCGPLITSTASCKRTVRIYDIRDGEQVMKWELQNPVLAMNCSSPLHWRNKGKVVIAESNGISLWDVNSLRSQALMSIYSGGHKISALHVNNMDAELGGGVRQRISSVDTEGNDGVSCTPDSINVLDFRHPSGIGLKIPKKIASIAHSVFSRGDHIYIGGSSSQIQQLSVRKQQLLSIFSIPEPNNAPRKHRKVTQVWGDSRHVMGICGLGMFVFDALKEDRMLLTSEADSGSFCNVREVIGPDDMYYPSFDYRDSGALVISRDRPARWSYLLS